MVWIICILVLKNNYLVLLLSDIIDLFSNIKSDHMYGFMEKSIKIKMRKTFYAFLFGFISLSNLI